MFTNHIAAMRSSKLMLAALNKLGVSAIVLFVFLSWARSSDAMSIVVSPPDPHRSLASCITFLHPSKNPQLPMHLPANALGVLVAVFDPPKAVTAKAFSIREWGRDALLPVELKPVKISSNHVYFHGIDQYRVAPKGGFKAGRTYKVEITGAAQEVREENPGEIYVTIDPTIVNLAPGQIKMRLLGVPNKEFLVDDEFSMDGVNSRLGYVQRIGYSMPAAYLPYRDLILTSIHSNSGYVRSISSENPYYYQGSIELPTNATEHRPNASGSEVFREISVFVEISNDKKVLENSSHRSFEPTREVHRNYLTSVVGFAEMGDAFETPTTTVTFDPTIVAAKDSLDFLQEAIASKSAVAIREQVCKTPVRMTDRRPYPKAEAGNASRLTTDYWINAAKDGLGNWKLKRRRLELVSVLIGIKENSADLSTRNCAAKAIDGVIQIGEREIEAIEKVKWILVSSPHEGVQSVVSAAGLSEIEEIKKMQELIRSRVGQRRL